MPAMFKYPFILYLFLIILFSGCDKNDEYRIPVTTVRIEFRSSALWSQYGVHAFPDYQKFILNKIPNKSFIMYLLQQAMEEYYWFAGILINYMHTT